MGIVERFSYGPLDLFGMRPGLNGEITFAIENSHAFVVRNGFEIIVPDVRRSVVDGKNAYVFVAVNVDTFGICCVFDS